MKSQYFEPKTQRMQLTLSTIFRMFDFSIYFSNYGSVDVFDREDDHQVHKSVCFIVFLSLEFEAGKSTFLSRSIRVQLVSVPKFKNLATLIKLVF